MRYFRNSIRRKLVVLLLASTIVPIVFSIVVSYSYTKNSLKQQAIEQNTRLINETRTNVLNYLGLVSNSSLSIYSTVSLDSLLTSGFTDYQNDSYLFTIMQIVSRSVSDIYQVYLSVNETQRAYLLHQNNFNQGAVRYQPDLPENMKPYTLYTESTHLSHNYGIAQSLPVTPELVFTIHRPIFRVPSNERLGLLSIDIRLDALSKLCSQLFDADQHDLYILDDSGKVVYAADTAEIGNMPQVDWMKRIVGSEGDSGYLEWNQSEFSGIMVYSKIKTPYLHWTIVKRIPDFRLYKYARDLTWINMIVATCFLLVAIAATLIVSLQLTKPLKQLISHISKIQAGQLDAMMPIERSDEIGIVARRFQTMMDTINDLYLREYRLNLANKTNQLNMLQAQINPHFINNALQSIGHSALESNAPKVYMLVSSLGQMMHYSMNTQETVVPLSRELEHVKYYCALQMQRFEDKLQVCFDIPKETFNISVPKMIVQPLVENYFKHGFDGQTEGGGMLKVGARLEENSLILWVEDNGIGVSDARLDELRKHLFRVDPGEERWGDSIGLINVLERLRLYYGDQSMMELSGIEPHGFKVRLTIPLQETGEGGLS
ncbi:histidine kinase [Paenibacillus doosanensis]|uniref:sensor histidine kinase n=1 Tax=Paenibacillus doosanensis TaxID=1229154 RepID=UPI00217F3769|nr:sensor histidine kinase [Paenibacillus doosanensis]MCS7461198.1 histidine kinase [Paenibacillus doosanensis]